jgi:hypothetical protein
MGGHGTQREGRASEQGARDHQSNSRDQLVRSAAGLDAKFAHDAFHQAPFGECALQQVGADKSGEGQPPLAHENRAAGYAQRQRQQNEKASDESNDLPGSHEKFSLGLKKASKKMMQEKGVC